MDPQNPGKRLLIRMPVYTQLAGGMHSQRVKNRQRLGRLYCNAHRIQNRDSVNAFFYQSGLVRQRLRSVGKRNNRGGASCDCLAGRPNKPVQHRIRLFIGAIRLGAVRMEPVSAGEFFPKPVAFYLLRIPLDETK